MKRQPKIVITCPILNGFLLKNKIKTAFLENIRPYKWEDVSNMEINMLLTSSNTAKLIENPTDDRVNPFNQAFRWYPTKEKFDYWFDISKKFSKYVKQFQH